MTKAFILIKGRALLLKKTLESVILKEQSLMFNCIGGNV